ncbi:piRNA biogenesis protein EXD1 [Melanotaenia boesemani]|uniref:piRNA biogenesis protein EXD1 n=1 Tax=Melanotaenia boesemani TaxID=1250792 RepID=UPI001C046168|nr:piRNA biogenesis protein EXD1 [Melanotaenia boesemani]
MVVDDVLFMSILKGQRIKLTLKTSSYSGVVQRVNPNKTLILADVTSSDGCKLPGTKLFFGHEILNVEFHNEESGVRGNIHSDGLEEQPNVEKFQPCRTTMTLDSEKDEEELINFAVIDEFHEKFGPAVMHIKKQHVIGVGAEGVETFKNGRLCWLQIATKTKVYLFDILLLGVRGFKNGLSMILESKNILKVIHDCRAIAGCLISQFGVKLTNVFDTQVADVMCFHTETGGFLPDRVSTLEEVLSLHLKVPPSRLSSLQVKSQLTKEEREMCYKRPCPVPLLNVMALSVIHLQPLRLVLLDTLMADYMALVDSYLNNRFYKPDELGHVSMEGALELPSELRQIDKMRYERQEWATNHYPVTEEGLLARFNPHPESSSQASPEEEQSKTQPVTFEPLEPPSSPKMSPLVNQQTANLSSATTVLSVDAHASSSLPIQSPAKVLHLEKEKSASSCLPAGVDRGCEGAQMEIMGRGAPFGKDPSSASLTQDTKPQPGCPDKELSKDTSGLSGEHFSPTPQSLSFSLSQSFRSFRY